MVMGNNCWAKELCILNETDNMWYKFIEIILTTMEFKSAGTFPVTIRTYKAGKAGVVHVAVNFYFSIVFWYDNIC